MSRRRAAQRRREQSRRRVYRIAGWGIGATVVALAALLLLSGHGGDTVSGSAASPPAGPVTTVDGIPCGAMEATHYHVHAHLAVFVRGQPVKIPAGIGIVDPVIATTSQGDLATGGTCFFWLHSHTDDGIIHVEAPGPDRYTLGEYFDIWHQPLGPSQVGGARGAVVAYVDGKRFTGDPRDIELAPHAVIQLDVDDTTPPRSYTFAPGS